MTRGFYSYAIFFTILHIIASLFQTFIIYFQPDIEVIELRSLPGWFIFSFVVGLAGSLIVLKYYHYKQYRFVFWVTIAAIVASTFYFFAFHRLLITHEITSSYFISALLVLIIGVVHGMGLIFSAAGERPWLRWAGMLGALISLALIASTVWALFSMKARMEGTIESIERWMSVLGGLVPVLIAMNFLKERAAAQKVNTPSRDTLEAFMGMVALVAVIAMLMLGTRLTQDSRHARLHKPEAVPDWLRKMVEPFEARTFANGEGDTLRYRFMRPLDYDSTRAYPLVICLHGSSGCGTDNAKQVPGSLYAPVLSDTGNRKKYPAFLFVPQCPVGQVWGGIPNSKAIDSLLVEAITDFEREFSVDERRRYVVGISLGGFGAWHLIGTRPEMFAAAVPICGVGNPDLARNMVDVPVWAFHGTKDLNVPVSGSRDVIEAVKSAGGNPRYTEYADEGHNIGEHVKKTPELLDWIFAQKRD